MGPLLHDRLCTGAWLAEVLLRLDALTCEYGVRARNDFITWNGGRQDPVVVIIEDEWNGEVFTYGKEILRRVTHLR
jgi:hypothetical protein